MSDLPVMTLLLNAAKSLALSVTGIKSAFVNPENYQVWENADKPVCLIFEDIDKPKPKAMRVEHKFELNFEIYMQSGSKNDSSSILDEMHAQLNSMIINSDNAIYRYASHIEEIQKGKLLGYQDLVALVNIYEVTMFTLRGNPRQVMR